MLSDPYMCNFEGTIANYRKYGIDNELIENVILSLHNDGFSIIESMKVIRSIYKISLGDAKRLVTTHPVWNNVVRAHESFHEQLLEMMVDQSNEE